MKTSEEAMSKYDMFDKTQLYQCPYFRDPMICTCLSCQTQREWEDSSAILKAAQAKDVQPNGSSFPVAKTQLEPEIAPESKREKIERQRKERVEKSEKDWENIQNQSKKMFMLGWMQNKATKPKDQLWSELFTDETSKNQKLFIKQCNSHLNDPVRNGEIVIVPTMEPTRDYDKQALFALQEDAKAASQELGKLSDAQVSTLNRHLELLDHYASQALEAVKEDGLPSDYYGYASLGVGIATDSVTQNLNNIKSTLSQINNLYVSQVAMASRTGGINYGPFIAKRAELFKKLDSSFSSLSKRSIKLPAYKQIRRNLKLSTKSVIHNADEIVKNGLVKNLGMRIANISKGLATVKGLGYVGIGIGAMSSAKNMYEACKDDGTGDCGKTVTREVFGLFSGLFLAGMVGSLAVGTVVLALGYVSASAGVIAIATIGAAAIGGAVGGIGGTTIGKELGDAAYSIYESTVEFVEDIF